MFELEFLKDALYLQKPVHCLSNKRHLQIRNIQCCELLNAVCCLNIEQAFAKGRRRSIVPAIFLLDCFLTIIYFISVTILCIC